ncbi:nuclear factor 1 A-type isoform X1 [Labeo rohita]|uniref:Nuclear factor 1 A-type isoform X1 n=1 Tax=Labeo rohita TaxID=84645 RepID=A0A498MLQ8_LABRO|nr:nuclear factor 1 A-type isoform X1 [Labeo rohita]
MKLADSVMAAKTSEGSIKWQLCYDISARTWWMWEPAGARGQAATDLSKVTPGKAGSTSVALMHPGTLSPPLRPRDAGRDKPVRGRLSSCCLARATLEGMGARVGIC